MAPREGPIPHVDVRQRDDPRPQARRRSDAAAVRAGEHRHPAAPPACAAGTRSTGRRRHGSRIPTSTIDHHVRHIALPRPGSMRQLLDLATLIVADPFERTRPLWQFVVVDGLRGGKSALIQKMHHTVTDGERGVQTLACSTSTSSATRPTHLRWRHPKTDDRRTPRAVRRRRRPDVHRRQSPAAHRYRAAGA